MNKKVNMSWGENHHLSKLTKTKIRWIKHKYAKGGVSQRTLAKEYKVSQMNIWRIVNNLMWRH